MCTFNRCLQPRTCNRSSCHHVLGLFIKFAICSIAVPCLHSSCGPIPCMTPRKCFQIWLTNLALASQPAVIKKRRPKEYRWYVPNAKNSFARARSFLLSLTPVHMQYFISNVSLIPTLRCCCCVARNPAFQSSSFDVPGRVLYSNSVQRTALCDGKLLDTTSIFGDGKFVEQRQ